MFTISGKFVASLGCALLALTLSAERAGATMILASSYNTPCTPATNCSYEGGPAVPYLAQQITLNTIVDITSIDAALAYSFESGLYPSSDLKMEIVNDASGAPGSTVYAADTSVTGTLAQFPQAGGYNDINFAFANPQLGPGTYWIVLTWGLAPPSLLYDWQYQNPGTVDSPGIGGTFTQNSYVGTSYSNTTFMATINGDVPEPATVLTSLFALAGIGLLRRRR